MSEERNNEMKINPDMYDEQIINKRISGDYASNEAQIVNDFEYVNKYGKITVGINPNTRVAKRISQIKHLNFGCIGDLNIDTIPKGLYHLKGTEITALNTDNKEYKDIILLNRRFLSKVLKEYCIIMGIQYRAWNKRKNTDYIGINNFCIEYKDKSIKKPIHLISGVEVEQIIHLILDEMRNRNLKCFNEYRCKVNNPELPKYINTPHCKKKISDKYLWLEVAVYQEITDSKGKVIPYDELNDEQTGLIQRYYRAWLVPRYSWEYLNGILQELNSGDYFKDIYMPIIYDLYKFPIKNTDIRTKPLTDNTFNKAKTEYEMAIVDNLQYDY